MRRIKPITYLLVALFVLLQSFLSDRINSSIAQAGSILSKTYNITYNSSTTSSQSKGIYDQYTSLTTNNIAIDVGSGNVIQDVALYYVDGSGTQTLAKTIKSNVGAQTWSGATSFSGLSIPVISKANKSQLGYYAWYRYGVGGSKGPDWYEDGGSSSSCGADYTDIVNGTAMARYPGCSDSNLSMGVPLSKKFQTNDGSSIFLPNSAVSHSVTDIGVSNFASDTFDNIIGPSGVPSGKDAGKEYGFSGVISSFDNIRVKFAQNFNYASQYVKTLSTPGAEVMVYYFAFYADVTSKTYLYPNKVIVTYKSSATPTAAPLPTVTPTPTAAPTPTPTAPPMCSEPVTIQEYVPSSAKQGEDFTVSAIGSKDGSGGSNLSYQWYYYQMIAGSPGPVTVGPTTAFATLNIHTQGNFQVILGITDNGNPVCSAQNIEAMTITPPSPTASVLVYGNRKINRPLILDGSSSSSPSAYPIVDSTRQFTITPLNGALPSDSVTLESLSGTSKLDTMLRKAGAYKITYTLCNTLSLCDTYTTTINIADDQAPIVNITGQSVVYRDPGNSNLATNLLTVTKNSPDGDALGVPTVEVFNDVNNDGFFSDDVTHTLPATYNATAGTAAITATVTAATVGNSRATATVCETFDPGLFASYLTTDDFKCGMATFDFVRDNQAPTMSINATKNYKADVLVDIGSLPSADQTYIKANISNLKTNLLANGMNVNFVSEPWNTGDESNFFADMSNKLNHDITWRNPTDAKFAVGFTDKIQDNQYTPSNGNGVLNLNFIPATTSTTNGVFVGGALNPGGGRNGYLVYHKMIAPNPADDYNEYTYTLSNGSASYYGQTGYYISPDTGSNYSSNLGFDTENNMYSIKVSDADGPTDYFRKYYDFSSTCGGARLNGDSNYVQQISIPSYIHGQCVVWSSAGINFMTTYQQNGNYFRRASNGWNPTIAPDYYNLGSNTVDLYSEGYQVGANNYWFGSGGHMTSNGVWFNLSMHYNGGSIQNFTNYNAGIYGRHINGNSITILVSQSNAPNLLTLITFTNGVMVSQTPLAGMQAFGTVTVNWMTNTIYEVRNNGYASTVTAYDMTNHTILWVKNTSPGVLIYSIGWDTDGITPLYLFGTDYTNVPFISTENDVSSSDKDAMRNVSLAKSTVSYNDSGAYSWVSSDTFTATSGTDSKIESVDATGKYRYKSFSSADNNTLIATHTYSDGSVAAFGYDSPANNLFYVTDADNYSKHDITGAKLQSSTTNYIQVDRTIGVDAVYLNTASGWCPFDLTSGEIGATIGINNAATTVIQNGVLKTGPLYTAQQQAIVTDMSVKNSSPAVQGFIGDTNYVYGANDNLYAMNGYPPIGGYTNDPLVPMQPQRITYDTGQNLNGFDSGLFSYSYYPKEYFNTDTNSFSIFGYVTSAFGIFYDNVTGEYKQMNITLSVPPGSDGEQAYSVSGYANDGIFTIATDYTSSPYKVNGYRVYKIDKNGSSVVASFSPTLGDNNASVTQDSSGNMYILSGNNLMTNMSGSLVNTVLNIDTTAAYSLFTNHGYIILAPKGNAYGKYYYVMSTSGIVSTPPIQIAAQDSNAILNYTDVEYVNGNIYSVANTDKYNNSTKQWVYTTHFFDSVDNKIIAGANSFYLDGNDLYITAVDTASDGTKKSLYKLNAQTMALEDKSPGYAGTLYAMSNPGKVMMVNYTGTAQLQVIQALDSSLDDPTLAKTLVSNQIIPLFAGNESSIGDSVASVIQQNNGALIDTSTLNPAQSIAAVANKIVEMLRNTTEGADENTYYLLGDSVNLQGIYGDYEHDPLHTHKWNIVHDPSIYDHNQGIIATSGQDVTTPISVFDHVGEYTVSVSAEDDPSAGYVPLFSFAKWSSPDVMSFYVNRKPIAMFTTILRDDVIDAAKSSLAIADSSYDLDHSVTLPISKGIVQEDWKWKLDTDGIWTVGMPPSSLPKGKIYLISLTVTDLEGEKSDPYTVTINSSDTIADTPPVVNITDPLSADPNNPTVFSSLMPTFKWSYNDADGDSEHKFILNVLDGANTMVSTSGEMVSGNLFYVQNTNLSPNVVYSVEVKASDGYSYGAYSARKYFKIVVNHPPIGNIAFSTPIYEHDSPLFTITQTDQDANKLDITVESSFNGGSFTAIQRWSGMPSDVRKSFTDGPLAVGNYRLKLTLDDGNGGAYSQIYSFVVLPLAITGMVAHTADWDSYRIHWNTVYPGKIRLESDFWAGEALELSAQVTDTGAGGTKPVSVTATLLQTGDVTALVGSNQMDYTGEMLRTNYVHVLTDGAYRMRFQIQWSNGMIETNDVPFQIKGNIYDEMVVQLRN